MYKKRTFEIFDNFKTYIELEKLNRNILKNKGNKYQLIFNNSNQLVKSSHTTWNLQHTDKFYYYNLDGKIDKILTDFSSIGDCQQDLSLFDYSNNQILEKKMLITEKSLFEKKSGDYNYDNIDEYSVQEFKVHNKENFHFKSYNPILFISEINFKKIGIKSEMEIIENSKEYILYKDKISSTILKYGKQGRYKDLLIEQVKLEDYLKENIKFTVDHNINNLGKEKYGYKKEKLCYIENSINSLAINYEEISNFKSEIGILTKFDNMEVSKLYSIQEESIQTLE